MEAEGLEGDFLFFIGNAGVLVEAVLRAVDEMARGAAVIHIPIVIDTYQFGGVIAVLQLTRLGGDEVVGGVVNFIKTLA